MSVLGIIFTVVWFAYVIANEIWGKPTNPESGTKHEPHNGGL